MHLRNFLWVLEFFAADLEFSPACPQSPFADLKCFAAHRWQPLADPKFFVARR